MAQMQIKLSVNCYLQPILHYDVFLSRWNLILSVVTQLDYAVWLFYTQPLNNLINLMRWRCVALREANGAHTRY